MTGPVWRTHLRLAVRSWGLWLVAALGVGLAVLSTSGGPISRMFYNFNEMAAPFFYLGQMLLTAAAAQRERSEQVDELIEAMPYEVESWVASRFLVHYLLWLAASVPVWAAGALMVVLAGHPLDLPHLLLNWVVVAPVTLAFTTAISLALGTLARQGVATYFLTVITWFSGPFSQILLSKGSDRLMLPLGEWYASGRIFPHATTGFFYNAGLLAANRGFALGAAGIALAAVVIASARRRHRPVGRAAAALLLATLVAGSSTVAMASSWNSRYRAIEAELAQTSRLVSLEKPLPLTADQYDLVVTLAPHEHRFTAEGSFDLTNSGSAAQSAVELTLRQNLTLTRLEADGRAVPYERSGNYLRLSLPLGPGETKRLTAAWEGEVWQWRLQSGPRLAAHIAPESILLPAHYGWYPLPGRQLLTTQITICRSASCEPGLVDHPLARPTASFRLQVSGTDLTLIHNAGGPVPGLYLVGTPFPVREEQGMQIAFSPAHRVQAERMAAEIAPMIAAYEEMVPRHQGPVRLIESHDGLLYGAPWQPSASLGATPNGLMLYSLEIGRYWPGYFETAYDFAIQGLWWPSDGWKKNQQALYRSFGAYMEYARGGQLPGYRHPSLNLLITLEEAKGQDAALQVLRSMYALLHDGGPSMDDFALEVRRASGDSPTVAEALRALMEYYR